jgi:hypothetical protein|tara:strand:+ start:290 stop:574 length:285 start_codon:yes stop_codon:yes gene_type:complete
MPPTKNAALFLGLVAAAMAIASYFIGTSVGESSAIKALEKCEKELASERDSVSDLSEKIEEEACPKDSGGSLSIGIGGLHYSFSGCLRSNQPVQ